MYIIETIATTENTPHLSTVTTCTPNSPMESSSSVSTEEPPWNSTATDVAKALADAISTSTTTTTTTNKPSQQNKSVSIQQSTKSTNLAKPPTTDTCNSTNTTATATTTTTASPFLSSHEPTTELKEGIEWVSFVYSHHRTLRRYCIRTDLDKVDTSILDDKFKKENCVSFFFFFIK